MGSKPKTSSSKNVPHAKAPNMGDKAHATSSGGAAAKPAKVVLPHPDLTIEELRDAIENANDVVYTHDLEGDFNYTNAAARRIFGYRKDETQRLNIRDLLDETELSRAQAATAAKLAGRPAPNPYLINVKTKTGGCVTLELSTRLIHKDGKPVGVQGIERDITARLRAEAALRESEVRFRGVTENAPCAIIIYQGKKLVYANPGCTELSGYSMQELMQMEPFWNLAAPEHRDEVKRRAILRMSGQPVEQSFDFKIRRKDGGERWVEF